jgi:hypothetical protein
LVVLWDFRELQGFQMECAAFQIFCRRRRLFGRIPDAVEPHSTIWRHTGPSALNGSRGFTVQLGGGCVHSGAAIRIERILNLANIPVFGKKFPSSFRMEWKPVFAFETERLSS